MPKQRNNRHSVISIEAGILPLCKLSADVNADWRESRTQAAMRADDPISDWGRTVNNRSRCSVHRGSICRRCSVHGGGICGSCIRSSVCRGGIWRCNNGVRCNDNWSWCNDNCRAVGAIIDSWISYPRVSGCASNHGETEQCAQGDQFKLRHDDFLQDTILKLGNVTNFRSGFLVEKRNR